MAVLALVLLPQSALAAQEVPQEMGILDLLLFGLLIFVLIRFFRRRFGGRDDQQQGRPPQHPSGDEREGDSQRPGRPADRHEAARAMWDMLSSEEPRPDQTAPVSRPAATGGDDFDPAEFIEGAKMFFSRFHEARSSGSLTDLKDFIAPELYEELLTGNEAAEARTEVMLVDARLGDRQTAGGKTVVSVFFDATLRKGVSGETPYNYRGVWEFSKPENDPDALWTLEKMERVDH